MIKKASSLDLSELRNLVVSDLQSETPPDTPFERKILKGELRRFSHAQLEVLTQLILESIGKSEIFYISKRR